MRTQGSDGQLTHRSLDRTNVVQDILSRLALEAFVVETDSSWLGVEMLWVRAELLSSF